MVQDGMRITACYLNVEILMIKCDISKCHASCCYNAPLPKKYIFALKNRIVTPVKEILVIDDEKVR